VAYRSDHIGPTGDLRRGVLRAAFETAVKAESCPGFGKLVPATTTVHANFTAVFV
jgi:hypothetical protein